MKFSKTILEEELKNKVALEYFNNFDTTKIIGKIDFCISLKIEDNLFKKYEEENVQSFYWAEAKKGNNQDIIESVIQLILTIGKAKTYEKFLPPIFLGAFDCEKIIFVRWYAVANIFSQNDFNWNVTSSDHSTKEFSYLYDLIKSEIENQSTRFNFENDEKELKKFIEKNFKLGKNSTEKIQITKNNFTTIYLKWLKEVKPTINIDWEVAKKKGILDSDFYLADLLSKNNETIQDSLYVLLKENKYELNKTKDIETGLFSVNTCYFNDNQKKHKMFWTWYERPPKKEFHKYILERRDLLVPQDIRERKGSYFTPQKWVELSQKYIEKELGENWQDNYYIWDCCAGTGNMEVGLTNKYNVWVSTLDKADVDIMKQNAKDKKNNLLDTHIFQFDFLNDDLETLKTIPEAINLYDIIKNEEKRKKLIIYINPPYKEASSYGKHSVSEVSTKMLQFKKYSSQLGKIVLQELFIQFLFRIYKEIPNSTIANFSTLKPLSAVNFKIFRKNFKPKLKSLFLVPANTFDNVKGEFPIGFFIWDTKIKEIFKEINADVYNKDGFYIGKKNIISYDDKKYISDWRTTFYDLSNSLILCYCIIVGSSIQSNNNTFFTSSPKVSYIKKGMVAKITINNINEFNIYFSIRHSIEETWLNDRDQFLFPNDGWKTDKEFQSNCLIYTLFHNQNKISSKDGTNHFIPFTEKEVNSRDSFESHFITDYIKENKIEFSEEAKNVLNVGKELWKYYHSKEDSNPNASFYDIKEYFKGRNEKGKMNNKSTDENFNKLTEELTKKQNILAKKIKEKVYEYEFLKN